MEDLLIKDYIKEEKDILKINLERYLNEVSELRHLS